MVLAYFAFLKSAPSSTSAVNAAKTFSIWHSVNIAPFRLMGYLSCGVHHKKKCPADWLRVSLADK